MRRALATILLLTLIVSTGAGAATFLVLPDGNGDFPTISDAMAAASAGDTILLGDGIFLGAGNRDLDMGGRAMTVRSQSGDAAACILDCQSQGRGFLFQLGEDDAVLESFTIQNGSMLT
ncbi:MAG: hypothetical protein KC729_21520, partial [Candidatus Eisenbacteria bacterium]|nr:hypothetical protein [Candidatus Eisenbacteria bacterium]